MRSLKDFIKTSTNTNYYSSDDFKEKQNEELQEFFNTISYKDLNISRLNESILWINSKDKDNFYHNIQTWSSNKYSSWINKIINENLHSTSIKDFCAALDKKFYEFIEDIKIQDSSNNRIDNTSAIIVNFNQDNIINDNIDEVIQMCEFHRWYITILNKKSCVFEPLDTEEVTEDIKKNFNNKIYRLIKNKTIESVKKNGLVVYGMSNKDISDPLYHITKEWWTNSIKSQSKETLKNFLQRITTYRLFPNRVFVFYTDIDPIEAAKELGKTIKNGFNPSEYSVVEVDLKHHKIPIFRDSMMDNSNPHIKYGYSNIDIPPQLITKIRSLE